MLHQQANTADIRFEIEPSQSIVRDRTSLTGGNHLKLAASHRSIQPDAQATRRQLKRYAGDSGGGHPEIQLSEVRPKPAPTAARAVLAYCQKIIAQEG